MKKIFLLALVTILVISCNNVENTPLRIWFDHPADASIPDNNNGWQNDPEWLKALPAGNGFLGAMVFGDVSSERIQLNEKSLWSGSPDDNDNPDAFASLGKIRELLFKGEYREATELTSKTQVCKGAGSGNGNGANVPYGCYQTLGDLRIIFNDSSSYSGYRRELDLERGVVTISYLQNGIKYKRELFASYPDRALVIHLSADKKNSLNFRAFLNRPERYSTRAENDLLLMSGTMSNGKGGEGMKYAVRLRAISKTGKTICADSTISVSGSDEATLILTAATNYRQDYPYYTGDDPADLSLRQIDNASSYTYKELLKRHVDDYSSLAGKVSLRLTPDRTDTIPTDRRLKIPDDLRLQEVYFQFGRYLLISSSREGSLPANLQGMWANKIQTPWNCDYHTDINVQMNYWPADMTNLSDCYTPLTELIESIVKPGARTAEIQYHSGGWCIHPITNVWGFTAPGEHPSWGLHVGAGGWLCQHLWDHFNFTLDTAYLRKVYPVMLGSARFYLDWLVNDPITGKLVSGPASSPENTFIAPDGSRAQISMGPSHDQEVIHELFTNVLSAAEVLKDNDPIFQKIDAAVTVLAMPGIGSDGRLMEWREEFKEVEPAHRHVSHLYMLHPGNSIDPEKTPGLAAAARKSLDARTDIGTGWSLAWKINFWARLHDGERAYKLLKNLLRPINTYRTNMSNAGGTYENLFCGHPPYQVDGNFGAVSGIGEMLLQSHIQESNAWMIRLLPAIPGTWSSGEVRGLKARGGFEVSIKWESGKLTSCEIKSLKGSDLVVRYGGKEYSGKTEVGKLYHLDENLNMNYKE
ncbi:MAG TPA: glycoside hydrolase family 95 protein [Bacteroidales bacterium]|nr:glycoside hydrolase family 95 protein [Bacteroidales bacterium]